MPRTWNPDPAPFGNARGLDYVSVDVKARIAHRFGATVTAGHFADDIQAEQEAATAPERDARDRDREPFAVITVSHDGLTISGDDRDGRGYTRGYRSSYWLDRMDADTIVIDVRTIPEADVMRYAVRGPMADPTLPANSVSGLDVDTSDPMVQTIADNFLGQHGGLTAQGY